MKKLKIKIGARKYNVTPVEDISSAGEPLLGAVNFNTGEVFIRKGLSREQTMDTVLHELLHAVAEERDVSLSEKATTQLASGLLAMFVDNPRLFGRTYEECF